jgi:uncharacterized membrane protein YfcA
MMFAFALIGLVGVILMLISALSYFNSKTIDLNKWVTVFFVGLVLTVIGWTGGLAIRDIEEDAIRQEYEYEYNYCPHCGERLKEE